MRPYFLALLLCYVDFGHADEAEVKKGETFYLIPKTQKSCLPANRRAAFRMGADKVQLLRPLTNADGTTKFSKVLAFPGCFEMNAQMTMLTDLTNTSVIMFHSFKWLQALSKADVSSLDVGCSDSKPDGCGGTGNKCFYCDICKTLKEQNEKLDEDEQINHDCPSEVGRPYDYVEERCVKDWGSLDEDKDGKPDFMDEEKYKDYAQFLEDMKIEGYGTMRLTILMATNGTADQMKQYDHAATVLRRRLKAKKQEHQFNRAWEVFHKRYWLKKMLDSNLMACVNVFFDMCKDQPIEDPERLDAFQCISNNRR